ncbi:MAG: ABC transporter permease [Candidatus Melainabacteria bacterium]|nr:ABC transporter permease [Candidatus Melainabacteria bacterium]
MNWRVVRALIIKYAFICSRNSFRAMDLCFWPVMDLLVWGFVTVYMLKVSHAVPAAITFLIAATIMWNVLYRAQQVISVSFLDDVWSRNLLNIFVAPIKVSEYIAAAYLMGLVQAVIVVCLLGGLACLIYSFNVLSLGVSFALLFGNLLLMGWSMGLLTMGCILRWGPPAEALAWAIPFLVQPLSAVFYPVSILPAWLQPVAWCVPASHVFEGMRQVLEKGQLDAYHLWAASLLNILYMVVVAQVFQHFLAQARKRGYLAKYAM